VDPYLQLARVPSRPPRFDIGLTAVFVVWGLLEAAFVEGPGSVPVRVAVALLITLPLLYRRRLPMLAVGIIAGTVILLSPVVDEAEMGTMPFPQILLATFSVALYGRTLPIAIGGLALSVTAITAAVISPFYDGGPNATNIAIMVFFIGGAWGMGYALKRRAAQARQAMAESGELARRAVAEERARIARELHDVVAHSVSTIAVQAGAAEQQLERDPAQARQHLDAVRRTSREAMTEMRRLLDVLRTEEAEYAPQPGLERLDELLATARDAGVQVSVEEEGERPQLSPGLDLTVYRIVQEALTNVRKHAGAVPATVRLRYGTDEVEVDVVNERGDGDGATPSRNGLGDEGGHGLIGMQERARLFGGTFEAGSETGGFRVHVRLPIGEAA
jgi:signal transduction histidine kinase